MSVREIQVADNGEQIVKYKDGFVYTGEGIATENGGFQRHGKGSLTVVHQVEGTEFIEGYTGSWAENEKDGLGTYNYPSGATYTGEWRKDCQHGIGTYLFPDGSYYEGEWQDHRMHGKGLYVDIKGVRWAGEFRNGSYKSNRQAELKRETYENQIIERHLENCKSLMQTAIKVFTVEKKSMKENSKALFAADIAEEVAEVLETLAVKFEEKKPDVWFGN